MTENDVHNLSLSNLYEFRLYNGITKFGYIKPDYINRKYYIVHPRNRSDEFEVKLEQIVDWPIIDDTDQIQTSTLIPMPSDNNKTRKAIILGAGASYDFTYDQTATDNQKLPLTKSLFHDRYTDILKKYPGAYDLSSEILLANNIEDYFQKQWQKVEQTYDQLLLNRLINTQYYIHDLLSSLSYRFSNVQKSNYLNLIKLTHEYIVKQENNYFFPIISFNYDTLIEEAITRQLKLQFNSIDDYVNFNNRSLLLFKPHGSSNWVKSISPGTPLTHLGCLSKEMYTKDYNLADIYKKLSDEIKIMQHNPAITPKYYNYYPWILIPYKDKDEFMMPYLHDTILKHLLSDVNEILIIGWKGTENKFKQTLSNRLGHRNIKITIVDVDKKATDNFKAEYSSILPNLEVEQEFNKSTGEPYSFSEYIKLCQNSEEHFFV